MSETILVVDDEQRIIDLAKMYLEQEGYRVTSATDGAVALQKILSEKPGLVVLDLMLPGIDGWEICRRVRKTSAIPIIVHTALESEKEISQALRLGIDDYLIKPLVPKMLLARIEAVMNQQVELNQTIWLQWSANLLRHLPVSR